LPLAISFRRCKALLLDASSRRFWVLSRSSTSPPGAARFHPCCLLSAFVFSRRCKVLPSASPSLQGSASRVSFQCCKYSLVTHVYFLALRGSAQVFSLTYFPARLCPRVYFPTLQVPPALTAALQAPCHIFLSTQGFILAISLWCCTISPTHIFLYHPETTKLTIPSVRSTSGQHRWAGCGSHLTWRTFVVLLLTAL
jgi:hypothetical protein